MTTKIQLIDMIDGNPVVQCIDHAYDKPMHVKRLLADGDTNTKTLKNKGKGYLSAGLSLAPFRSAGVGNVCTDASEACVAACLDGTGLGSVFPMINAARKVKTWLFYNHREWFLQTLQNDIVRWENRAEKKDLGLCVRLNMFSDVLWENFDILARFPNVQFYDYTKHLQRNGENNPSLIASNYWLTFSRSETNEGQCLDLLSRGANVAMVFHTPGRYAGNRAGMQTLPKAYKGFKVINGDLSDARFLDTRGRKHGRIVGLKLKAANNDNRDAAIDSGFSIEHRP